jgi:hypothetical protein
MIAKANTISCKVQNKNKEEWIKLNLSNKII